MEDYKPKEYNPAQLTKMYVQTKLAVENKVNYPVFGPHKINGIHRVFPLYENTLEKGTFFFITGTGLQKANKDFFDVVFTFYKENQDDFKYLVFSPEIKSLEHINYCEDAIVCHKSMVEKVGPVFQNSEAFGDRPFRYSQRRGDVALTQAILDESFKPAAFFYDIQILAL